MLEFNLTNEKLILFSAKAAQVKHMIDYFLTELKKVREHLGSSSASVAVLYVESLFTIGSWRKQLKALLGLMSKFKVIYI